MTIDGFSSFGISFTDNLQPDTIFLQCHGIFNPKEDTRERVHLDLVGTFQLGTDIKIATQP